ncbi:MAG: hypothetical protein NWR42_03890 [Desulfobacterales bacterium]|nr:hypothetical protein [Desulfobacterales bacterium]
MTVLLPVAGPIFARNALRRYPHPGTRADGAISNSKPEHLPL